MAAQHAANRSRGASGSGGNIISHGNNNSLAGGGRSSPVYLPEMLSQAIYVPTQKITTLHPGASPVVLAAAASAAAAATAGGAGEGEGLTGGEGKEEGTPSGEDGVDIRLSSTALTANPSLLKSVTGERNKEKSRGVECR